MSKGISYLKNKLSSKQVRIRLRYNWYDMKASAMDLGISTPPNLVALNTVVGWNKKAVDCLAERLQFREFANDIYEMNGIFQFNNPDIFFDSAIQGALISSCSFVSITRDNEGYPRLQVIDGYNATGVLDPFTNMMSEGYAVLSRDDYGNPVREAYYTEDETIYYLNGKEELVVPNPAPFCLLVPVIFQPDAIRPFGHSRISRACMAITESAIRTIKRSEISAEFYSFPQKYIVGLSQDAEPMEKWKATMASMLQFTKDDEGDSPSIGQFQQQSMGPHLEQLKMFASLFAGETGLTLDDLGFTTDNPSSVEAIKASHESLRLVARKAQHQFGTAFLNVGYLSACVRDDNPYRRELLHDVRPKWEPVFEPDINALSMLGDSAIKMNQALPGYFDEEVLRDLTGIAKDGGN